MNDYNYQELVENAEYIDQDYICAPDYTECWENCYHNLAEELDD